MMKVRLNVLAIISLAAALGGCVSYGNTHALITPLGAAGYHTFKPDNVVNVPRDIRFPEQRTPNRIPDRIAATNEENEQPGDGDEI